MNKTHHIKSIYCPSENLKDLSLLEEEELPKHNELVFLSKNKKVSTIEGWILPKPTLPSVRNNPQLISTPKQEKRQQFMVDVRAKRPSSSCSSHLSERISYFSSMISPLIKEQGNIILNKTLRHHQFLKKRTGSLRENQKQKRKIIGSVTYPIFEKQFRNPEKSVRNIGRLSHLKKQLRLSFGS